MSSKPVLTAFFLVVAKGSVINNDTTIKMYGDGYSTIEAEISSPEEIKRDIADIIYFTREAEKEIRRLQYHHKHSIH